MRLNDKHLLSYGEILSFGGDFFGTIEPIAYCDSSQKEDCFNQQYLDLSDNKYDDSNCHSSVKEINDYRVIFGQLDKTIERDKAKGTPF